MQREVIILNIITKAVFKLLKDINGNINYTSLCNYINSKGFILVELHTEKGDEILKRFECYEEYTNKRGITVIQECISFVIVDSRLPAADKVRILLHEIGHINLHFENQSTFDDISKMERENQAEIFAYTAIKMSKFKFLYKFRFKNFIKLALIIAALSLIWFYKMNTSLVQPTAVDQPYIPAVELNETAEPSVSEGTSGIGHVSVYVTPTGEVFHKAECSYVNPSTARELTISEAENKGYRACKRCRPTDN